MTFERKIILLVVKQKKGGVMRKCKAHKKAERRLLKRQKRILAQKRKSKDPRIVSAREKQKAKRVLYLIELFRKNQG